MHIPREGEFARLGFAESYGVSAAHGRGVGELASAAAAASRRPPRSRRGSRPRTKARACRVWPWWVGPNVGKSSLTNAILGEARTIVSEVSGTTRDAVDVPCKFGGKDYVLIDTAGIRHRGKRDNSAEIFSVMRSEEGIKRADLCVLVIDAERGDHRAGPADRRADPTAPTSRASSPSTNGICSRRRRTRRRATCASSGRSGWQRARRNLFFHLARAAAWRCRRCGANIGRLFTAIEKVRRAANQSIGTGPLNRLFHAAIELQPPPMRENRRFKLLYATQLENKRGSVIPVPAFLMFVNDPGLLTDTYRKYLENKLRETYPFPGLPVLLKQRGREAREGQGK